MDAQSILDFWFAPDTRPFWFAKNDAFDGRIRSRFTDVWTAASRGELDGWRTDMRGRCGGVFIFASLGETQKNA